MAVFVLGENMVVHGKVVLRFVVGGILERAFCAERDFVEGGVVNFKEQGFKDF